MIPLTISTDEATYHRLETIAQEQHVTTQEVAATLLKDALDALYTPQWAAVGLFASGKTDTSNNAEDILESEWMPD